MARVLEQAITDQITAKNIQAEFIFKINGIDYTDYMTAWKLSYDTQFGSASGTFTLNNNNGIFGEGSSI